MKARLREEIVLTMSVAEAQELYRVLTTEMPPQNICRVLNGALDSVLHKLTEGEVDHSI